MKIDCLRKKVGIAALLAIVLPMDSFLAETLGFVSKHSACYLFVL